MAEDSIASGWTTDLPTAAWLDSRLDRQRRRVTALVPTGYDGYALLSHTWEVSLHRQPSRSQLETLADILRGETTTPERCWFCVDDRDVDAGALVERVRLPGGAESYVMYAGPIERALSAPAGESPQHERNPSVIVSVASSDEGTAAAARELPARAPDLWWPEDRAWFVCIPRPLALDITLIGGSRSLIDCLLADPSLEAVEVQPSDPIEHLQVLADERAFGPVIASGSDANLPWSLRGRIDGRGASTLLQTSSGGDGGEGGALPFQDLGWKKLGHFGSIGSGGGHGLGAAATFSATGVVSKQTAAVDVQLADGSCVPAQIVDTGDPRASFFVAVWSGASGCAALIARDAAGAELETHPVPRYNAGRAV